MKHIAIALTLLASITLAACGSATSSSKPTCPADTAYDAKTNTCVPKDGTKPVCGEGLRYDGQTNTCVPK